MTTSRLLYSALLAFSLAACTGSVTGESPAVDASILPTDAMANEAALCGSLVSEFQTVTPTVQLLVDRSGSMNSAFGDTTRWSAVQTALMDSGTGVVKSYQSDIRFGVSFYTTSAEAGVCPFMEGTVPQLSSFDAISSAYLNRAPLGHTPTGESLLSALTTLQGVEDEGPKVIVLATDGLPDTCAIPHPNNTPEAYNAALNAARTAYSAGVSTVILSVGPDIAADHLQHMANAGAGLPVDAPNGATYYRALEPEALQAAFHDIVHGVRSCTFSIDTMTEMGGEEGLHIVNATLFLDDMLLRDGIDYRIRGDETVEVIGGACEQLQEGTHQLWGSFFCLGTLL